MTLEAHIDKIRKGLSDGIYIDEADVCESIVAWLLMEDLSWPSGEPGIIKRQYPAGTGKVDFALCYPPLKPKILVEVKRVGQIDVSAEEQLFRYAFDKGVPVLVLTDGKKWHFFYGTGEGSYDERRVRIIDLEELNSRESAELLRRYLEYESVCSGKVRQAIEADHRAVARHQRITNALPEAWAALVQEANELLLGVVTEKVRELCGDEPSAHQVLDFLKNLESRPTSESLITRTQRTPSGGSESTSSGSGRLRLTRLEVTMNGETIAERYGTDTFVEVIKRLGIERVYDLDVSWVATSEPSQKHRRVRRFYIVTLGSTKTLKKRLEKAASGLRVQLTIRIVPR